VHPKAENDRRKAAEEDARHLREAALRFFPSQHAVSFVGGSPGFSGSVLARVEASGKSWCLRRWPQGFGDERLRFVHRVLLNSRAKGFAGLPALLKTEDGETVLALAHGLYDAQEWLAGEPLSKVTAIGPGEPTPNTVASISSARIADLATALARFHLSTIHLSPEPANLATPLPTRLARLVAAAEPRHEPLLSAVQAHAEGGGHRVALRWLELLPVAAEAARRACGTFAESPGCGYALCHGDLWPAHVHFDGDAFVGFTDFESVCFASPALDLAQLALHFGSWELRENVLRSYDAVAPLDERDRSLLPVEAAADLVGEGYWTFEALYGAASSWTTPAQRAAHLLNLRELLGSLELVTEELGRLER
jgi:Ser/Thr protein kinase RdoA (MazF antagonist)